MVGFSHNILHHEPLPVCSSKKEFGSWHLSFHFHFYFWYRKFNVFKLCHWWWWGGVGTKRCDSWDPSQQIQGLKCPSQPNPNKNDIETCSVKLPLNFSKTFHDFRKQKTFENTFAKEPALRRFDPLVHGVTRWFDLFLKTSLKPSKFCKEATIRKV